MSSQFDGVSPLDLLHVVRPNVPAVAPPGAAADLRQVTATLANGQSHPLVGIPMRPGDLGYTAKIPPPAPDGTVIAQQVGDEVVPFLVGQNGIALPAINQVQNGVVGQVLGPAPVPVVPTKRVVVSYGPSPDVLMVIVEEAPDWEVLSATRLPPEVVLSIIPVLKSLGIKIKDMTGTLP